MRVRETHNSKFRDKLPPLVTVFSGRIFVLIFVAARNDTEFRECRRFPTRYEVTTFAIFCQRISNDPGQLREPFNVCNTAPNGTALNVMSVHPAHSVPIRPFHRTPSLLSRRPRYVLTVLKLISKLFITAASEDELRLKTNLLNTACPFT